MPPQSDTPGELAWADEAMAMHWIDRYAAGLDAEPQMSRILRCVSASPSAASDTAVPSDHAGLVALKAMLEMYGPHAAVADKCIYPDDHPITLAREAIAALSRAPEPVAYVSARTLRHHVESGASQTSAVLHKEQGELYGERDVPIYTAPTAPQPALALIEAERPLSALMSGDRPEWEHIMNLFKRHHLDEPPWRLRDELVIILTWARYGEVLDAALASAKRFKGE